MAETPPYEFANFIRPELERLPAPPEILEIGGGAVTYLDCPGARYTVVDRSSEALDRCSYADRKILGDAHDFDPGPKTYDVVVFWNVLEHLAMPAAALTHAARAVRPGGLLIVRGPELRSLKAIVTRFTPHWFHILFYRRVLGFRNAGNEGVAPFPVEHRPSASRESIRRTLAARRFKVEFDHRYVGDQLKLLRKYSSLAFRLYRAASAGLRFVSRNRLGTWETDFILGLRKA